MGKKIAYIALTGLVLVFSAGIFDARAEDKGLETSADVGVFTKYIWRGYELSNDSVVVQPSATLGYKGFALNAWANIDTDSDAEREWNETDLTLSYDTSLGPVSLGGGYIYYNMKGADDTQEIYVSAGYETFLSPTFTIYRDIDLLPGYYMNLGLSHSLNLTENISLDLSGGFGYYISSNDSMVEYGTDKRYRGLQDGLVSAGLTIPVNEFLTAAPALSYSFPLSDKAEKFIGTSGNLFVGVVLSFSF